jgi:hypothetical protein
MAVSVISHRQEALGLTGFHVIPTAFETGVWHLTLLQLNHGINAFIFIFNIHPCMNMILCAIANLISVELLQIFLNLLSTGRYISNHTQMQKHQILYTT